MAQVIYQGFFDDVAAGNVTSSADLRAMLLMANTTTDTEEDAQTMSDFTTIDEADGVGYAALDIAGVSVAYDSTNNRLVIDGTDDDFESGGIDTCSRNVTRVLIKRYVDGTDANDVPWSSIDIGPYSPGGGTFDVTWNTTGILYIGWS